MKKLSVIITAFILVFGTVASRGADLARISAETGIPVATLQAERASTGLGWGELEKAHLLANASGRSFDEIVASHKGGQGWGKIAHGNGLNLGKVVSNARHSGKATMHTQKVHGKSATNVGKGRTGKMTTAHGVGHGSSFGSGFSGSHDTHGMGGMGHGMGSMGHGGHGR